MRGERPEGCLGGSVMASLIVNSARRLRICLLHHIPHPRPVVLLKLKKRFIEQIYTLITENMLDFLSIGGTG
jgi:hypothetical protein